MAVQFGTNISVDSKRVLFYNRESSAVTLYEGMPVCYMFDTTTNILGYDKGAGGDPKCQDTPTTTAEGNQNEGKFLIVETPNDDNLLWFAGVIASSSKCGRSVAATSYEWIEIYEPNGAVVPVRCDVDTTVGVTILAITSGETELGFLGADSRPVAIAMETETDLDSTAGITLAKLDPLMFSFNYGTSGSVYAETPGTYPLNYQYVEFTSATPAIGFLQDNRLLSDAAISEGQLTVANNYLHITGSLTAAGATYLRGAVNMVHLDACTLNGAGLIIAGSCCQVGGTPTANTAINMMMALWVDVGVGVAPTSGNYYGMRISNNGVATVDAMISMYPGQCDNILKFEHIPSAGANPIVAMTGDHAFDSNDYALKVDLAGTTYYIPLIDALS